jgi:probable HAF family extracellular repeat protein
MRSTTIGILAFMLALAITGTIDAAVEYSVIDLGPIIANGISDGGQVVGSFWGTSRDSHACLWQSSSGVQDLGTLSIWPPTSDAACSINSTGQVVGQAFAGSGSEHAFLWQSGAGMQDLGLLSALPPGWVGSGSEATGINDNGQVVGWSTNSSTHLHAFLWQNAIGMQDLGTLGGSSSYATAINNGGQVVGYSPSGGLDHGFLWQSGKGMQDIGTLGGACDANSINNLGQVVGTSATSSSHLHAFLWQNGIGMQDLGTLGGLAASAADINDGGLVVGQSLTSSGVEHAFLWQSGIGMQDLNGLIDSSLGWTLTNASAINLSGQIVGNGQVGGEGHAYLLTPVPEPSTFVLLGIGAVSLLAYRWRQRRWTA